MVKNIRIYKDRYLKKTSIPFSNKRRLRQKKNAFASIKKKRSSIGLLFQQAFNLIDIGAERFINFR